MALCSYNEEGKETTVRGIAKDPLQMYQACTAVVQAVHVNTGGDGIRFKPIL